MRRHVSIAVVAIVMTVCCFTAGGARASEAQKDPLLAESGRSSDQERERILRELIDELDRIMLPPYEKQPGIHVRDVYIAVKDRMVRGDLIWSIVRDGKAEVNASFVPVQEGTKARIEVNQYLVDRATKSPTLAMTMIMHEMKHARDYFTIGEPYKKYMENPLERFMYEMDALFIEALFVRDFLSPRYKNLTAFERYVLESLEKDNLASVAAVFMSVDMDLTYSLYELGKKLDTGMSCTDYFVEFSRRGKEVFEKPLGKDGFRKYQGLIAVKTYATLASPLVDGAMARNKRCKPDEHKALVGEINGYVDRGNVLMKENNAFIDDYIKQVRKSYFTF